MSVRLNDILTEAYLGETLGWVLVPGVRDRTTVEITRGAQNESGELEPSSCTVEIGNADGDWSPRNPRSPYFGLLGQNTPLRVANRIVRDTFDRVEVDGWGETDTGHSWTLSTAGAGAATADFDVSGGVGTIAVGAANEIHTARLSGLLMRDAEVRATVSIPDSDITGQAIRAMLALRYDESTGARYRLMASVETDESIWVRIWHRDGAGTNTELATGVAGPTHSAGQALRIAAQAEGHTLRAKVWAAADPEPKDWTVSVTDDRITSPGTAAVETWVVVGNTDTPITLSWDDVEVRSNRFHGEASEWPPVWDLAGVDVTVPVVAQGISRRLGQRSKPVKSAITRYLTRPDAVTFAYWPFEDRELSVQVASASPAPPMRIRTFDGGPPAFPGIVAFASYEDIPGSAPLPVLPLSPLDFRGLVPDHSGDVFTMSVWNAPLVAADADLLQLEMTDGTWFALVAEAPANGLYTEYRDAEFGSVLDSTPAVAFQAFDRIVLWWHLEQDGADVDVTIIQGTYDASGTVLSFSSDTRTLTGVTLSTVRAAQVAIAQFEEGFTIGHLVITPASLFESGMTEALLAHHGETAGRRIERLCGENGIALATMGDLDDTPTVGGQRVARLPELLGETAAVDMGRLSESRGMLGYAYRTRKTLYNQQPALALSYGAKGEVPAGFRPVDDDQQVVNDLTLSRSRGSSVRDTVDTGRMSTQDPPDGIGVYDAEDEINLARDSDLPAQAAWRLHVGSFDGARYPSVPADLMALLAAGKEDLVTAAADVDMGDRVTVGNLPVWLPAEDASTLVDGLAESLSLTRWSIVANGSPEQPWQVATYGDDPETDVPAKYDTSGSELAAEFEAGTDTSMSVAVTAGPLWTTDAGAMPIQVQVAGVVFNVIAISGSSSPQTFTVDQQPANGVTKMISAGEAVRLAKRPFYGL